MLSCERFSPPGTFGGNGTGGKEASRVRLKINKKNQSSQSKLIIALFQLALIGRTSQASISLKIQVASFLSTPALNSMSFSSSSRSVFVVFSEILKYCYHYHRFEIVPCYVVFEVLHGCNIWKVTMLPESSKCMHRAIGFSAMI